jgi:ribosomal protein S18 acetylase RimI-like enzyme
MDEGIAMSELTIKIATDSDIQTIRTLAHAIWPVSYRDMISAEQISYMLQMMYSEDSLKRQMHDESCTFLIAEQDHTPLGFASYAAVGDGRFKLHKLYVLPAKQGSGVGKRLLHEVLQMVVHAGGSSIELQVNKHNKAKDFYRAMGFAVERELVLDIGGGFVMDDYVMTKKLN